MTRPFKHPGYVDRTKQTLSTNTVHTQQDMLVKFTTKILHQHLRTLFQFAQLELNSVNMKISPSNIKYISKN